MEPLRMHELLIIIILCAVCAWFSPGSNIISCPRGPTSHVKNNQRNVATGLESYFIDYGRYPPPGPLLRDLAGEQAVRDQLTTNTLGTPPASLTTPVAYITELPMDIFSGTHLPRWLGGASIRQSPMGYATADNREGFFIVSPGPDRIYSFHPELLKKEGREKYEAMAALVYDPSNGTISFGDILRTRQGIYTPFLEEEGG